MNQPNLNRRSFIQSAAASTAGITMLSASNRSLALVPPKSRYPIAIVTKPFQSLSYEQLASTVADLGVEGIEATVRDGGHIEPDAVPDELPKMNAALKQRGLEITLFASSINQANPQTERQLRTAAQLGIKRYRTQYYRYNNNQPIRQQLANIKPQFAELAAMNAELGIQGLYQNHAGVQYVGSPVWDLVHLLEGIEPAHLAIAFDIRHATAEAGLAWPNNFRFALPHIGIIYVKDFAWEDGNAQPLNVPLGQGRVDKRFFTMLKESGYSGPVSLHEEYINHADPSLVPQHIAAFRKDIATLRNWLAEA